MKKYILTIVSLVLLLSACDFSDINPESDLTYNGFWDTEEAARAAHIGIYAKYRTYARTFWSMGEVRSDIWGGLTTETPNDIELINNDISKTKVYFNNWGNLYGLLHNVNDFITNASKITFKNENEKNHLLAQIYGIRAHIYYTMLRAWGDVPITTEPLIDTNVEKLKKPRSPKAEVMQQVKADIAKSLELFGEDNSLWLNKNIYWSKAATLALKGDVYLWSGKVLGGGQADFQEAKNALQSISGFELVDYENLWGEKNENNKEFIFAFDYQQDQAGNFYSMFTGRIVDFNGLFDENGISAKDKSLLGDGSSVITGGASRFGPTDKILSLLDDKNDNRKNTFIRLYNDNKGHTPFTPEDPSYRTSVLNKFLGTIYDDGQRKDFNNIPLYRYADVLLMLAEAKNNLNEDPSAEINAVRERAYGDNFVQYKFTKGSQADNQKAILDERLKEFVGEGKRWWDLVRAGDGIVFKEVTSLKESEAYKIYYSISEGMIANDSELTQTEGYN
ncbi:MAG: RagB/SusD family nutrient uptake outer membrane protein [Phocaeicola sp.]|uniref:RagB/SusD family nutrient uptake outer membrane protein n=1 Tax=Phocaeicola TaxID=909656 RepID=UPI00234EE67E|nr:RagB/SusD family nutrient uptake outer membrane protein [Phocaeicola oris]MCE2617371.1 RagB/SusD family nutrient uptake outer membrane protein [Phocaeicola oris]